MEVVRMQGFFLYLSPSRHFAGGPPGAVRRSCSGNSLVM